MNKHVSEIIAGSPVAMALPAHAERDKKHFEGRAYHRGNGKPAPRGVRLPAAGTPRFATVRPGIQSATAAVAFGTIRTAAARLLSHSEFTYATQIQTP